MQAERHHVSEAAQEARQQPEPQPGARTAGGAGEGGRRPRKAAAWQNGGSRSTCGMERHAQRGGSSCQRRGVRAGHRGIAGRAWSIMSADEAKASERARSFAKAIDRQNRALKEGFAVVDERGTVTRIDQRVTGDLWQEIEQRLASIDRSQLLTVAEARDVMKEANREAMAAAEGRRAGRGAAGCATVSGTAARIRVAWALSRIAERDRVDALGRRAASVWRLSAPRKPMPASGARPWRKKPESSRPCCGKERSSPLTGRGSVYRLDERTTGRHAARDRGPASRHRPRRLDELGRHQGSDARGGMGGSAERAPGASGKRPARKPASRRRFSPLMRRSRATGRNSMRRLRRSGLGLARVTALSDVTALDALRKDEWF